MPCRTANRISCPGCPSQSASKHRGFEGAVAAYAGASDLADLLLGPVAVKEVILGLEVDAHHHQDVTGTIIRQGKRHACASLRIHEAAARWMATVLGVVGGAVVPVVSLLIVHSEDDHPECHRAVERIEGCLVSTEGMSSA